MLKQFQVYTEWQEVLSGGIGGWCVMVLLVNREQHGHPDRPVAAHACMQQAAIYNVCSDTCQSWPALHFPMPTSVHYSHKIPLKLWQDHVSLHLTLHLCLLLCFIFILFSTPLLPRFLLSVTLSFDSPGVSCLLPFILFHLFLKHF